MMVASPSCDPIPPQIQPHPGMADFILIFSTLISGFLASWFCGHCIAVVRNGGPEGPGREYYRKSAHSFRFALYVAVFGVLGIASTAVALRGLTRLWMLVSAG
jgi:hypothetical protein